LHQRLTLREQIQEKGGNVDVFGAIQAIELPLLLRKLDGLLGVYLDVPTPGVLVTTERQMSIQRFTAAHELGHHELKHQPSLDNDGILRRSTPQKIVSMQDAQEIAANAFAAEFLMPRWLIVWHCNRQGWTKNDFRRPNIIYQLSLRLGASYEATCWTLARDNFFSDKEARDLLQTEPRQIKAALLAGYRPQDYRGDVWLFTQRDAGTRIDGSRNDLFILRLTEHSGGGYIWDFDQLRQSGFGIVRDDVESLDEEDVGGPLVRRVTAASPEPHRGTIAVEERRPWQPESPLSKFQVEFDLTGPEEEGLSRAERRSILEAEWP
jgi:Zn-dependent peptidase ImmA (M78 family)